MRSPSPRSRAGRPAPSCSTGYDEEPGNSVFFERGLDATAICGDQPEVDAIVDGLGERWDLPGRPR
ncbi:hypothetical protein [Amycolatopsis sp. cmx-8-4]|uniref:hypothetical protein n=1 Tax=Amycolatopsis sp. cmx-8-4 TaxID=2790947 RepID=UPI00397E2E0C